MKKPNALKLARLTLGLTQHDLARRVGVSGSLISLIENGIMKPSSKLARKINRLLRVVEDVQT